MDFENIQLCLGSEYLGPQIFSDIRFVEVNSKYNVVSRIFELEICETRMTQKMSEFFPFGSQPASYMFPLAKKHRQLYISFTLFLIVFKYLKYPLLEKNNVP